MSLPVCLRYVFSGLLLTGVSVPGQAAAPITCSASNTVTARVVALEQVYTYNRFGSFNPSGLMYALERDVVAATDDGAAPPEKAPLQPGKVQLRADKRPRPLILRANKGDCLKITFTNLLSPTAHTLQEPFNVPGYFVRPPVPGMTTIFVDAGEPETRTASMHVNGLSNCKSISSDGAYVGKNDSSLVKPGEHKDYCWIAEHEGGFLMYSTAAMIGGEGDGGQLDLGLFGAVMVEPAKSVWYRSQVTEDELKMAVKKAGGPKPVLNPNGTPQIDYRALKPNGDPVLAMLDKKRELIYSDLNAVIALDPKDYGNCAEVPSRSCGSYREFSVIFHDEIPAEQAFPILSEEGSPLIAVKDGTAINYGSGGLGAPVVANRMGIGPTKNCAECKFEEFFLSSWANGDPAMVMKRDKDGNPAALYPDDPSNVHHSYLGDPVRFRNIHAGPKETHVFHLHAHQWLQDAEDANSTYLDSQTISPGGSFTYDIRYGGSGNRNLTPGDAIFHCHLYPHFAQGMWELWRVHDVFEDGSSGRRLPDHEIADGTPNPAIVPIPGHAMPLMPTKEFRGYPFYIAGEKGHRPPPAPMDLDCEGTDPASDCKNGEELNGGLPRHRIKDCADMTSCVEEGIDAANRERDERAAALAKPGVGNDLFTQGIRVSAANAARVHTANANPDFLNFARRLKKVEIERLPRTGTPDEAAAMAFHAGTLYPLDPAPDSGPGTWHGKGYAAYDSDGNKRTLWVNGYKPQPGAPYADPCSGDPKPRKYRTAYVQFDMTVNKWGWHDPQARVAVLEQDVAPVFKQTKLPEPLFIRANSGECVSFAATNLIPSTLNLDDYQIYTPTDVIGQHIHLVKFDVTASDGSGNGWNYEDGTLSADEVRERIKAHNEFKGTTVYSPVTHPLFRPAGALAADPRGLCADAKSKYNLDGGDDTNPWCGAQTTMQRWWADPLLNKKSNMPGSQDRTLRTVFTHDHFGPSSHQHHGLYAALVVEPKEAEWWSVKGYAPVDRATSPAARLGKGRSDGGPTSYAADVFFKDGPTERRRREFNIAVADYAIVYDADQKPVNPPNRMEMTLPLSLLSGTPAVAVRQKPFPEPEAISTKDPGTQLMNYRNEPIPLRIGEKTADGWKQRTGDDGDMANVFSSAVHKKFEPKSKFLDLLNIQEAGFRKPGDPATPVLPAQPGDIRNGQVLVRLIQGAQEENHVFTMHGARWRAQPSSMNSGYRNAQQIGISEHFEAEFAFPYASTGVGSANIGPGGMPDDLDPNRLLTDHLWYSSATDNLWDGMWGLMRVANETTSGLKIAGAGDSGGRECPKNAPDYPFSVSAWLARDILNGGALNYNSKAGLSDPGALLFVVNDDPVKPFTQAQLQALYKTKRPEPLVLRAPAGACIAVQLHNNLRGVQDGPSAPDSWSYNMMPPIVDGFNFNEVSMSSQVGLHPQLMAMRVSNNDSSNAGVNKSSLVAAGKTKTYFWYAGRWKGDNTGIPIEFGATNLHDMADVIKHSSHGAVGALIIEPQNSYFSADSGVTAHVCAHEGSAPKPAGTCKPGSPDYKFKEFVAVLQDDLSLKRDGRPMLPLRGGDDAEDTGQKAINYGTEPLWARLGAPDAAIRPDETIRYDMSNVMSSREKSSICDPAGQANKLCDPPVVFEAVAGTPVRFRILHPSGHPRQHGFTLFGHTWQEAPFTWGKPPLPGQEEREGSRKIGENPTSAWLGSYSGVGPARSLNIVTKAGGDNAVPGDYLFRAQESFSFNGGMWGIFRVTPK